MFERFTERARQVVVLAQEEARALKHNYIGTEHLLLGLLREEEGLAAHVLESLDITLERVRAQVLRMIGAGEEATAGQIPFTPRAKKVLELSLREAKRLGHSHIATEHILLGLLREGEGVAARILLEFDADAERVRAEVIRMLSAPGARHQTDVWRAGHWREQQQTTIDVGWLDGLGAALNQLAKEIHRELGREPDAGDLLLALAAAPHTLAARALAQVDVDIDVLWGQIERLRRQTLQAQRQLDQQIAETRAAKERALEAQEFETAAGLRDQERELTQQRRSQPSNGSRALQDLRRRLGLPTPPDNPQSSIG